MSIRSRLALTDAVVVEAVRTPLAPAGAHGVPATVSAVELLAAALAAVVAGAGVEPSLVDDVIVGDVAHPGGHDQRLATRAALRAGYPSLVPVVTVDRRSGSSQQAVHFAAQAVMSGASEIVVAAGVQTSRRVADGAAAVLVMTAERADRLGLVARALVHTMVVEGAEPAPASSTGAHATRTLLARAGLRVDDVDVFAVHEPHADAVLRWASELGVDLGRVNVDGGALARSDSCSASGTVLATALLHVLEARRGRFGVQVMSSDGGPVTAMVLERLDR